MRKRARISSTSAVLFAATLGIAATQSPAATPSTLYWDQSGNLNGAGPWDVNTTQNWSTTGTVGPADSTWTLNDGSVAAAFNGSGTTNQTYTVTIAPGTTINASSVSFGIPAGNVTIAGGTALNLTSPTASVVMNTQTTGSNRAQIISSNITGTDITVVSNVTDPQPTRTLLSLSGNNTFTGNLILAGTGTPTSVNNASQVNINSAGALPSTANVLFARDWSQLLFTAGGASGSGALVANFSNNINLNSTGSGTFTSYIGSTNAGSQVTLSGVISGGANLNFGVGTNGGSGTITLANSNNSWTGATTILVAAAGSVRLGVNNALPQTTTLAMGNAGSIGSFDLAGFNQTVAALSSTNGAGSIINSSSTASTLTLNGSATTSFNSPINNNITLSLAAAHTGSLTLLSNNGYTGGTTVNGGTLVAGNTTGSATGTGPVTVGSNGTLATTPGTNGALGTAGTIAGHVTSSGALLPGSAGSLGTLNLPAGLTASAGASLGFDVSTTANDKVVLAGATDADVLTLPGTSQSVSLKLNDLGGALHNGQAVPVISYPASTTLSALNLSAFKVVAPPTGVAQAATFAVSNNTANHTIDITVSNAAPYLTWRGGPTGSGTWDAAPSNTVWTDGSSPAPFVTYSDVTFNDSANAGDNPVVVSIDPAGIFPARVTVNNSSVNYTLQGGSINGNGSLNKSGTGTLTLAGPNTYSGGTNVTGGTLAVASDASLGTEPASPAINISLTKTGADPTVLLFNGDANLGPNRTVQINQTNGGGPAFDTGGHNVTIAGTIQTPNSGGANLIKQGSGTLTLLADNSSNAAGGYVNAVLVNGGTLAVSQDASLGKPGGAVTLNSGTLKLNAAFNPAGRPINIGAGGGTVDTNGFNATLDGVVTNPAGNASFNKNGAGTLTLTGANTLVGPTAVNAGSLVLAPAAWAPVLSNAGGGVINGGKLVFDYAGTTAPDVRTPLIASHNSSNFTDPAQRLRTANAPDANHGIGYLDNTATSKLTLMYTWYGDANLDGTVTPDDYALLDRAAAGGLTASWVHGDFNYDGVINSDDYLAIDTSFGLITGQLSPSFLSLRESQFGPAYVQSLIAAVPEPTSLSLLALTTLPLLRRRRRA